MRFKADWVEHLHTFRKRELEVIFGGCPDKVFDTALELGAGDGFQSILLIKHARHLTSTDYQSQILHLGSTDHITYAICDAEEIGRSFAGRRFDLVFSSNLLEHVPRVEQALSGIKGVLADRGIAVHVVPNSFWTLCRTILHIPNLVVLRLERILTSIGDSRRRRNETSQPPTNNPKSEVRKRSRFARWLIPEPHGVSLSNRQEFVAFSQRRWRREFERAGFRIVAILKGPVSSGYGFGLDRLRRMLEWCGVATEFVYVATKDGCASPFEQFFTGAAATARRSMR